MAGNVVDIFGVVAKNPVGFTNAVIAFPPDSPDEIFSKAAVRETEDAALQLGVMLHHARWTFTDDPGEIQALAEKIPPQYENEYDPAMTVAQMMENPGWIVGIGHIYWATKPPPPVIAL